ncbi:MAG: amino acid ABC transporter permease [Deltaproteobacteria bacterium]|nr:amino acid ABC transporter permease [Deltaproteobacteria bacterium]
MDEPGNHSQLSKIPHYNLWVGVFVAVMLTGIGLFYLATQKVEYIWGWYRIPTYFLYEGNINTVAEFNGRIRSIEIKGDKAVITLKGAQESEVFTVPASSVKVEQGDSISEADVIASYKKWKAGVLIIGLWLTVKLSLIATILGILVGIIGGLCRISSNPALKWLTIVYVELIRGSPLLVQIIIWYYVMGTVINDLLALYGIGRIPAFWYGVLSLACFAGAYVTEIVRAGIQSIHRGQIEASRSLGMTYMQSMGYIILPQALRRILPPLAGQFISLIKDSSLLGVMAISELLKSTREAVAASLMPFELYFLCAILYLFMTFSLSMFVQYLEKRMATT